MRNKLLAILLCLPLLLSCGVATFVGSTVETFTVAQVENLCGGIVVFKESQSGVGDVQSLIDGQLCDNAGISSEFYVMALSQSGGYDFRSYENALLNYLSTHSVSSASTREKYALALCAAGSTDRYITDTANEAIGGLGIMSLTFGLHLLNNGYASSLYSVDGLIDDILANRTDDGGWCVIGSYGDVDVTAMTIQALAPYYGGRSDVTAAIDDALTLLSERQQDTGGFRTMGAENSESAAQVVIALSSLGIDAQEDGRFIKDGGNPLSALMTYRSGDGSFAHTGSGTDENATMQAYCALTAYLRMRYGQSPLYIFDNANHGSPKPAEQPADSAVSAPQNNSGANRSSSSGNTANQAQNGDSGNSGSQNIIVIDGRRYIEATNAAGENVTVSVEETQSATAPTIAPTQKPTYGGMQSSATADSLRATADEAAPSGGYKIYAVIGVLAAAGAACAVLYLLKKRNRKNYIAVGIIAAAGVAFILLTNFESADSYHREAQSDGEFTVTLSIRCDTITDREKVNEYIPDDGVILKPTGFSANEGDTVYDVLLTAVRSDDIPMDNRGAEGAAYIAGLNFLYEYDYGELSGWMYRVNGKFPDVGCQSCFVHDGDVIEWLYTTDIGNDLS